MPRMEHRRGRRLTLRSPWRRAAIPIVVLLAATLATAAAVNRAVPLPLTGAYAPTQWFAHPSGTPEDDAGGFVDPTPTTPSELGGGVAVTAGLRGPHVLLPILLYHYIRVNPVPTDTVGFNLSVTPAHFAEQMAFLHFIGAHTLSLSQALAALRSGRSLPPRSLILTFDDGYMNFATKATPVMIQNGLTGTVFVVSGFMGRNGYMTAAQVKQVADEGMTVGCHTVSHVALATVPPAYAKEQIDIAHSQLQALIGRPVPDFAYPYGSFDPTVEKLVQEDGFSDAVTTEEGADLYLSQPYAWPRYRVGGADTLRSFADKALLGTPVATINHDLAEFLASPDATSSPSPTPHPVTAQSSEDSRRYS